MNIRVLNSNITAATLAATFGISIACWVVTIRQMNGTMDMGGAPSLRSFISFITLWAPMMAAMMLPGTAPAALRYARAGNRVREVSTFLASYLAVWTVVGVLVHALYRQHGSFTASVMVIAAGAYELSPLKHSFRRRCGEGTRSGFRFGLCCLGSCVGLMLVQVALGIMSITWMSVIAVLVTAQKMLPPNAVIDVPLAVGIIALGILIQIAPALFPGVAPAM